MMIISDFKGKSVSGLDGEAAAQRLRGRVGTTVKVKVLDVFPYPQHISLSSAYFITHLMGMRHAST
jgi:hypothetical protein